MRGIATVITVRFSVQFNSDSIDTQIDSQTHRNIH